MNGQYRLSRAEQDAIEKGWQLEERAFKVLDLIVAEFESDPMSVQCFDSRIVQEAKAVIRETRENQKRTGPFRRKLVP